MATASQVGRDVKMVLTLLHRHCQKDLCGPCLSGLFTVVCSMVSTGWFIGQPLLMAEDEQRSDLGLRNLVAGQSQKFRLGDTFQDPEASAAPPPSEPAPSSVFEGIRYRPKRLKPLNQSGQCRHRWASATDALDLVWGRLGRDDRRILNAALHVLDEQASEREVHLALETLGLCGCGEKPEKLEVYIPAAMRKAAEHILPQVREALRKDRDSRDKELNTVSRQRLRALEFQLEAAASGNDLTLESVCGHDELKRDLEQSIAWPFLRPDIFTKLRQPPQGILLYGPPGNGKTMIAEALANRLGVSFYQVRVSDVISKYSGDSEKNLRSLCDAARAEPLGAVVFLDEIDSLASSRDAHGTHNHEARATNELLQQMDGGGRSSSGGITGRVVFVAATNRPWSLDAAIMRRLPRMFYLGPPTATERSGFFTDRLRCPTSEVFCQLSDKDLKSCALMTEGFSYSALEGILREACAEPIREAVLNGSSIEDLKLKDIPAVKLRHVELAISRLRPPTLQAEDLEKWETWKQNKGAMHAPGNLGVENHLQHASTERTPLLSPELFWWFAVPPVCACLGACAGVAYVRHFAIVSKRQGAFSRWQ